MDMQMEQLHSSVHPSQHREFNYPDFHEQMLLLNLSSMLLILPIYRISHLHKISVRISVIFANISEILTKNRSDIPIFGESFFGFFFNNYQAFIYLLEPLFQGESINISQVSIYLLYIYLDAYIHIYIYYRQRIV